MNVINSKVEHKTLKLDEYGIHYYVTGHEKNELIIFLHPAFSDHRAFNEQIDYFSENYRVITIDFIGHGLSKAKKSKDKIDSTSLHINKIIEIEAYDKAHLVGVSLGSLIAQYFAYQFPTKVLTLTALGSYNIHKKNKEVENSQFSTNLSLIFRVLFSMNSFRRKIATMTCETENGKTLFYETTSEYERKSFVVMQGLQNIIKNRKNIKTKFPIFIITGEFDIALAIKMAEKWHSEIDNSQYFIIKNAGHCANMDKPIEFNNLLQKNLNKAKKNSKIAAYKN